MKEIELPAETPEQLLQFLEAQRLASRLRREQSPRNRAAFLAAGFLLIVAVAGIALMVLSGMVSDLPRGAAIQAEPTLSEQR